MVPLEQLHLDHTVFIRENSSRRISERYQIEEEAIGSGGYAKVFFGRDSFCLNRPVAIKRVPYKEANAKIKGRIDTEVRIMRMLDHPSICKLFETYYDGKHLYFVMEMCMGGDLFKRLRKDGAQDFVGAEETTVAEIIAQVSVALVYAASKNIAHRDIKIDNLCFASEDETDNSVKVIDWGVGSIIDSFGNGRMKSTDAGTVQYMAPEIIESEVGDYTAACDVWSLGVMTYMLLCGKVPFWGNSLSRQLLRMKAGAPMENEKLDKGTGEMMPTIWMQISDDAKDFVKCLLKADPAQRLPIDRVLEHPWLQKSQQAKIVPTQAIRSVLRDMTRCRASKFSSFCIAIAARQRADREIKDVFCKLDMDNNGEIDMVELKNACVEMFGSNSEEARSSDEWFRQFDLDGSGKLDYTEFCAAALGKRVLDEESSLRAAFAMFDVHDSDEKITKEELEEVLFKGIMVPTASRSPELSDAVARDVMSRFDQGNGHLDFDAWANMVRNWSTDKPESEPESRVPTALPSEDDMDTGDGDSSMEVVGSMPFITVTRKLASLHI
jgi:calcium-dependent protein kinase